MTVYVNVFVASYPSNRFYISQAYDTKELALLGRSRRKRKQYIATVPLEIPTKDYLEHQQKFPLMHLQWLKPH